MSDRRPELFEPCVIQVDFCNGMASVEVDQDGMATLVWYRRHRDIDGSLYHHVAARMTMPHAAMIEAAGLMLAAKGACHDVETPDISRRDLN